MKLKKWLKYINTPGLNCNIYIKYEKKTTEDAYEYDYDLIYAGSMWDIPYWLVEYKIDEPDEDGEPIFYATGLRKHVDDEEGTKNYNGFIINLIEKGE